MLVRAVLIGALCTPVIWLAGKGTQMIRLPVITGYLLVGILLGPFVLSNLSSSDRDLFGLVEQMCIAVIAAAAGAELQVSELKRTRRQVIALTVCILVATWLVCMPVTLALAPYFLGGYDLTRQQTVALASMSAILMGSRSPAAALAILRETKAKGPFASLSLAVIVVKDITVVVLFAFNMDYLRLVSSAKTASDAALAAAAAAASDPSSSAAAAAAALASRASHHGAGGALALLQPLWHVVLGWGLGSVASLVLEALLFFGDKTSPLALTWARAGLPRAAFLEGLAERMAWTRNRTRRLLGPGHVSDGPVSPSGGGGGGGSARGRTSGGVGYSMGGGGGGDMIEGLKLGLVPLSCLLTWAAAQRTGAEPLVACVALGLVVANRSERGRGEIEHIMTQVLPGVFIAFFALMGANQRLASLVGLLPIGAVLYAVRLGAIYVGTWAGYGVGGGPAEHRRIAWLAYVTQAGLEMGLASTVGKEFSGWGRQFSTVMVGAILLNLMTGSPMFKRALALAGEGFVGKRPGGAAWGPRDKGTDLIPESFDPEDPLGGKEEAE